MRFSRRSTPLRSTSLGYLGILGTVLLVLGGEAGAVLIASGDGSSNTTAPTDDPGWAHVAITDLNAVYLDAGWIITANHASVEELEIEGRAYRTVPGSKTRLENADSSLPRPDLALYKIHPIPELPELPIRALPPQGSETVILVGRGRDRGDAVEWMGRAGWQWKTTRSLRWGTNRVHEVELDIDLSGQSSTRAFSTDFSGSSATEHEAQVTTGDSGGAAFIERAGRWELAGILFAASAFYDQPDHTSLFGNRTLIADLSHYRDSILEIVATPACDDGLDDDGDGLVDYPEDPGCDDFDDTSEHSALLTCDDGIDNDGDGLIDFPGDPGCTDGHDDSETFSCSDAFPLLGDANGDGAVDGADYSVWADNYGLEGSDFADGDFNCDGLVDGADYVLWADNFGGGASAGLGASDASVDTDAPAVTLDGLASITNQARQTISGAVSDRRCARSSSSSSAGRLCSPRM